MKLSLRLNAALIGFGMALLAVDFYYAEKVQSDVLRNCHTSAQYDKSGELVCSQIASK